MLYHSATGELSNAAVFILLQQTDSCHDHSERRRNALALGYRATSSSCDSYADLSGGGFGTLGTSFSARINQEGRPPRNQNACLSRRRSQVRVTQAGPDGCRCS